MTVAPFDIIAVDFPFVERQGHRRRPALVLSDQARNAQTGTAIIAMITRVDAAPWPGDVAVTRFDDAGLHKPCKVRLKLHTVDLADVRHIGSLVEVDRIPVVQSLKEALPL